jgi:hypothetical protein
LIIGAGVGAVYTVTAAPPPCGVSEMDITLTPTVAQSSDEASLISTCILADCVVSDGVLLPPPPPQAARVAIMTALSANCWMFENMDAPVTKAGASRPRRGTGPLARGRRKTAPMRAPPPSEGATCRSAC